MINTQFSIYNKRQTTSCPDSWFLIPVSLKQTVYTIDSSCLNSNKSPRGFTRRSLSFMRRPQSDVAIYLLFKRLQNRFYVLSLTVLSHFNSQSVYTLDSSCLDSKKTPPRGSRGCR